MPLDLQRDIQTCRGHHAVLRGLIERFPGPDAAHGPQIRAALRALEMVLMRHLAFEDARLYPALAGGPPGIAERARRYREEMGGLSSHVAEFMKRWTGDGAVEAEPGAFAREWDVVRVALEGRMAAEDDDLYERAEAELI